ncbi:MAG: ATP-binding protein [Sulfurimonadaceae bacterium]
MTRLKNRFLQFLNSSIDFDDKDFDNKLRHNIINLTVLLAIFGLLFGIINNIIKADYLGITVNSVAIIILLVTASFLRIKKEKFNLITTLLTLEFMVLFDLLLMISEPSALKHIWLVTFPALIFFFKGTKTWLSWITLFILSLFLTKFQPFYPINYTFGEIIYISVVVITMTVIIYFYKSRIDLGNQTITKQKEQLELLAKELESKVEAKTKELQQLNLSLEQKVEDKAKELIEKDAMILAQSRQAAMGEMISMIAHQWRQPLSTITLQIANIKINAMMGKSSVEETNDALEHISETIIYLSETIDDFQTFFRPDKEKEEISLCELIERSINFVHPRLKVADIKIEYSCSRETNIIIHTNELAQVIINLINNGIDVLLERKIEKPMIQIESVINANSVEIHIIDNAGGIDQKIINKIFEPYFSTKGKNGTGLGLYMSKMIIEKELGGNLQVTNDTEGAKFMIGIPQEDLRKANEADKINMS